MVKAGFGYEGTRYACAFKCGKVVDEHVYTMLRPSVLAARE